MVDFNKDVLQPAAEAEAYIAETGGLPEITAAANGLLSAISKTRVEIDSAQFASRFPQIQSAYSKVMTANDVPTQQTRERIEAEGEAGLKRSILLASTDSVEATIMNAIDTLVRIRADLAVSQQEF